MSPWRTLPLVAAALLAVLPNAVAAQPNPKAPVEEETSTRGGLPDGTVHVGAFDLPLSDLLSSETRRLHNGHEAEFAHIREKCPVIMKGQSTLDDVIALRSCFDRFYYPRLLSEHHARFAVTIRADTLGGVPVEVFTPRAGVSDVNRGRVLINVHGGSFTIGRRWGGQLESIPIAAVGGIEVISVDYRLAPEYQFPAASEDVVAVYRALLKDHEPSQIGIYGCSAGAIITAQVVAWLIEHDLPRPGAIGMFCAGAVRTAGSDSARLMGALAGGAQSRPRSTVRSYMPATELNNPLAFPGEAPALLARFPPSLLITGTRDALLSDVVETHRRLVRSRVEADLHVWEGLGHGFFYYSDFAESREAYEVIARFFERHLK